MCIRDRFSEHVDGHQMEFAQHLDRDGIALVVETEQDLHTALDRAIADPESMLIDDTSSKIDGVINFGEVLDELLGISTPVYQEFEDLEPTTAVAESMDSLLPEGDGIDAPILNSIHTGDA